MRLIEIFLETLQQEERMELAPKWLVDDLSHVLKRAWSIRVAMFWGGVQGLLLVWTALVEVLPLWVYVSVGITANASVAVARVLKQPGADE